MDNKSSERGSPPIFPRMGLRILLVESDDSTRFLIAALLRKCSYKVVAVSDGLKAWETLKARPQNIDLILTEFDLPSISGYALLTLIMKHDICKRIPVIMASSQDSISLVLRCMSRGAADFLVKPIRRNEIMNLWQHVWRRQNKTEGLAVQNTKVAKHEVDTACTGKDFSSTNVNGRDTRNEESLQLIEKSVSSTSKIGSKPCGSGSEVISREETNKSNLSYLGEDPICARSLTSDASKCLRSDLEHDNITHELVEPSTAIDYISKFKDYSGNINGCSSAECVVDELTFLDLSLRRPSPNGTEDEGTVEQQVLNHSNASAFSRYDNTKTLQSLVANQNVQAKATVTDYQIKADTICHNYIAPESYSRSDSNPIFSPSSDVLGNKPLLPSNRLLCSGFDNQDDTSRKSEQIVEEKDNIGEMSNSCSGSVSKLKSSISSNLTSTVDDSDLGPSVAVTKFSVSEGLNYSPTLFQERTVMDSYSLPQREAALQKFRLKRKDRCFDKKVRYQSRKRLAEQRPRVKGQFVRQVKDEAPLADGCVLPSRLSNLDF